MFQTFVIIVLTLFTYLIPKLQRDYALYIQREDTLRYLREEIQTWHTVEIQRLAILGPNILKNGGGLGGVAAEVHRLVVARILIILQLGLLQAPPLPLAPDEAWG